MASHTNKCFVNAKQPFRSAWSLQWFLVRGAGRLMRAKHSLLGARGKAHVTSVAPAPSEAASCQIQSGTQHKYCPILRPNTFFCCDARPRPPADDCECGDKSNPFGKVSTRAGETLAFEAFENSKRGNCHWVRPNSFF